MRRARILGWPQNKWMQLTRSAHGETSAALAADPCVRPTERDDADGSVNGTEPSPPSGAELRTLARGRA
jgi:hypothetical protein